MPSVTADSQQTSQTGQVPPGAVPPFERLVEQHQARVARLAQRLLGWSGDVEDVVQEVFVSAWRGLAKFRGQSGIETWLMRITINQCRRHRRRSVLRMALQRRLALEWRKPEPAGDPLAADEHLSRVRRAVGCLPARYREVIVLRYLEGLEVEQVMRVLDLSRSAADVRLHRGRQLLKDSLQDLVSE